MIEYIANKIENARDVSLADGIKKYKTYFLKTKLYKKYKDDVDAILTLDGYEDCIVE